MKKTDKEILRKYVETVYSDERMIKYLVGEASEFVELEDNTCIILEKPSIETSFCYGYRLSSTDSIEYDNANKEAENAKHDVENFINENKKNLINKSNKYVVWNTYRTGNIVKFLSVEDYEDLKWKGRVGILNIDESSLRYLSDKENEKLNEKIDKANETFMKRVDVYLKKYGLSNVKSWSYWVDL